MSIETLPPELWLKIPLPFMPWHPYILEIDEKRVIFRFECLSPVWNLAGEFGNAFELARQLTEGFKSFKLEMRDKENRLIICFFKDKSPE